MAKKHGGKPKGSGWPRAPKGSPLEASLATVQRLADDLAQGRLGEQAVRRYMSRLMRMVRDWREFDLARVDSFEFQDALNDLTEEEQQALFQPHKMPRRASKARTKLMSCLFDLEAFELLHSALLRSLLRAGSPDDLGALALVLFSLRGWADGSVLPDNNPLLVTLVGIGLSDLLQATAAIEEAETSVARELAEGTITEEQRRARLDDAMAQHPVFVEDAARRYRVLAERLIRYVETGVVHAHLTADDLAPVLAELEQAESDAAAAGAAQSERVFETMRKFAADPANDGVFQRFVADLGAEQRQTQDQALARRLAGLVQLCGAAKNPDSPVRLVICQASLARLWEDERAAQATEPADGSPGEEAPVSPQSGPA